MKAKVLNAVYIVRLMNELINANVLCFRRKLWCCSNLIKLYQNVKKKYFWCVRNMDWYVHYLQKQFLSQIENLDFFFNFKDIWKSLGEKVEALYHSYLTNNWTEVFVG